MHYDKINIDKWAAELYNDANNKQNVVGKGAWEK